MCLKLLVNTFDLPKDYNARLYNYLRRTNEIQQATGKERQMILNLAKGDLNECKKIQFNEYFKNK